MSMNQTVGNRTYYSPQQNPRGYAFVERDTDDYDQEDHLTVTTVALHELDSTVDELNNIIDGTVVPCIGVLIVILNIVVIYYMIRLRRRQHNPIASVYMCNMVLGDLLVGVVIIVLKVSDLNITARNRDNDSSRIITFRQQEDYMFFRGSALRLALFISILNLLPLTLDRVWAVKWPISHRQSKRVTAIRICVFEWLLACSFVVFLYLYCYFKNLSRSSINNLILPLATYPTTLIFIACYIAIFKEMRSSRKYRQRTGSRSVVNRIKSTVSNSTGTTSSTAAPLPENLVARLSLDSRSSSIISLGKFDEKKGEVRFRICKTRF